MIIRGGTVVTAGGIEEADVAIAGDRIIDVGPDLDEEGEEVDASGLHLFPGGIDSHVHFNEPGRTEWEDIAHGSAALAAGGYTCFIDMPLNNLPVTTTVAAFEVKLDALKRSARVDYGLWAGLIPGNLDELEPLVQRGAIGFKAFMCPSGIDEFPACDPVSLRQGMKRIAELGSILLVHAEDPLRLVQPTGPGALEFIRSRPPAAERSAIATVIELADLTRCPLHVVHVSTAPGLKLIQDAQQRGLDVSCETCPHYLLYLEEDMQRLGGVAKCAPPFRNATDQAALWNAPIVVQVRPSVD